MQNSELSLINAKFNDLLSHDNLQNDKRHAKQVVKLLVTFSFYKHVKIIREFILIKLYFQCHLRDNVGFIVIKDHLHFNFKPDNGKINFLK